MIRVEEADISSSTWHHLIQSSHQATLYVRPEWMALHPVHAFVATNGSEPVGGIVAADGLHPLTFIPYQGLLLRKREDRETAQALISHVERLDRPVSVWNAPSLVDIRPFTWRWYDAQVLWQHDIRYTYICSRDTRFEPRHQTNVTGKPVTLEEGTSWFEDWVKQPWVSEYDPGYMVKILGMPSTKVYTDGDATVVWGEDLQGRGYYLASIGRPTNVLAWLIQQHDSSDLVGCNSPQRALFKRGFGGHLRTSYSMKLAV